VVCVSDAGTASIRGMVGERLPRRVDVTPAAPEDEELESAARSASVRADALRHVGVGSGVVQPGNDVRREASALRRWSAWATTDALSRSKAMVSGGRPRMRRTPRHLAVSLLSPSVPVA
jgi:hypothetical protein